MHLVGGEAGYNAAKENALNNGFIKIGASTGKNVDNIKPHNVPGKEIPVIVYSIDVRGMPLLQS